ncbi:hypothetical protein [Sphingomonas sp.]|jgi:hypothetical protein|uniref:hypothetical protein n=1 Tax=Sphingomonas sp. TaxID=28214 RepID=UPI002D81126C|nr:hypothetical protein [Sphingomonas sp.]HEU0045692.1 hypothetical protein [Sphingomonas sp.]
MLLASLMLLQSAAACTPVIPSELKGWSPATPAVAGRSTAAAGDLTIGKGAHLTLSSADAVSLPVPPGKPAPTDTSSGLVAFEVPAAGRYRVALTAAAWVDVVADGKVVASVAHGHGPACSSVRKQVDFDLRRGRHMLQVTSSRAMTIDLMVVRLR